MYQLINTTINTQNPHKYIFLDDSILVPYPKAHSEESDSWVLLFNIENMQNAAKKIAS